jgi:hypothetical protein
MRKYFFRTLSSLCIFMGLSPVVLSQEIPFNKAITVIQSAENSLKSAEWKCKVNFKVRIPSDADIVNIDESLLVDSQQYADYSVLYDIQRQTYLVEGESRLPWYEGSHPQLSSIFGFSYDGKNYSSWQRTKGGDSLPDNKEFTEGQISMDMNQVQNVARFHSTNGGLVGFGTGFPGQLTIQDENFYGPLRLSAILTEWNSKGFPISIKELSSDKWLIEAKIVLPTTAERIIRIHLLPQHGIITYFSRVSQFRGKEHEELRIEITVKENEDRQVVPHTVRFIHPLDRLMDITTFSSVKFNPSIKQENFQLSFPDGTIVEDFIAKKYYKVGDMIDEDQAISDFMLLNNLTGDVPRPQHRYGIAFRYILIGTGIVLIVIAIYLRFFRKRDK